MCCRTLTCLPALLAALSIVATPAFAAEQYRGKRAKLKGLVFEAEDWSSPKDAWLKDTRSPRKWCLWTTEQDVFRKRSMGASLQSPPITKDRATSRDGYPAS